VLQAIKTSSGGLHGGSMIEAIFTESLAEAIEAMEACRHCRHHHYCHQYHHHHSSPVRMHQCACTGWSGRAGPDR
jgi:hypothetical protein